MKPWIRLVDDLDDVQVPVIRQLVVQPADDVQFRRSLGSALRGPLQNLLVGHDVALGAFQVGAEGAERAAVDANVGRIEVLVDVVVRAVAVLPLADDVRQFAEREQISAVVKEDAVIEGQSRASEVSWTIFLLRVFRRVAWGTS
jgi:hypothetical protein